MQYYNPRLETASSLSKPLKGGYRAMVTPEQLKQIGLSSHLLGYLGCKFALINRNKVQIFAGIVESIGIFPSHYGEGKVDRVYIVPAGGGWTITSAIGLARDEFSWSLQRNAIETMTTSSLGLLLD